MTYRTRRLLSHCVVALLVISIAGCANTIRGVGRDLDGTVDATGDALKKVFN